MPTELAPVAVFLIAALLAAMTSARLAAAAALLAPVIAGAGSLLLLSPGGEASWRIMDYTLQLVRVDHFSLVMVGLFHLAGFIAAIYALHIRDRLQHAALLVYIAGGIGAALAGDLITLFIFFEMIAMSGTLLVLAARTPEATAAGIRYLIFQIAAGVTLLAGILIHGGATGDWRFDHIGLDAPGGWVILLAFGIKSGFPMLHSWIVDAYPKASLTGLAVLIAVTTKIGVYGLARGFAGEEVLLGIGVLLVIWPLFYMMVENDLRRVLAYAMMVQIGLMVAAIGVGSELALDGVAMHIVMDVLFKMTLFMALGVVLLRTGTTRADRLGGLWRSMPLTTACAAAAVAANVAMPFTAGFMSKKVLLAGIEYGDAPVLIWLFLVSSSALGILYAAVRILWDGFLKPTGGSRREVRDAPWPMAAAMLVPTVLLLAGGVVPGLTDILRPHGSDYSPFYPGKLVNQSQMLLFAVLAYVLLVRNGLGLPASRPGSWLDAEWLYRRGLPAAVSGARRTLAALRDAVMSAPESVFRARLEDDRYNFVLGRSWPIGSMALWVAILLAVLLLFGIRQ